MNHLYLLRGATVLAALSFPAVAAAAEPEAEGAAGGSVKLGSGGAKAEGDASAKSKNKAEAKQARKQARKEAIEAEKGKPWIKRHAPRRNSWELGVFGGVGVLSRGLELRGDGIEYKRYGRVAPDIGARVGYYPIRWFGIEAEGAVLPGRVAATDASALLYAARLQPVLQLPLWRVVPFATVGVGVLGVSSDDTAMGNDAGLLVSYGGGVKFHISRNIGLRFDVRSNLTAKEIADDPADSEEYLLGLVVRLGPKAKAKAAPSDRDGDGFVDTEDACADEAGVAPDGCPIGDADGDGFLDTEDACVDEAGVAPDGCPIGDADGDGFLDDVDQCVDEAGVEPDGCPIRDTDGDGILDDTDECVDEPETTNGFEDGDGCPDEVPEEVKKFTGAIEGIYFQTAKAEIRKTSERKLSEAAKVLAAYPEIRVEISGHTDDRGKRPLNMKLSADRAEAVKTWLTEHGIDAARITTRGAGPDEPVADNGTKDGRSKNRRIEFKIMTD
ncbi:MAG: OmpA family protein [Nannocystaceae bacterium]